jgi:F-type H+-transporting ATPase subunit delta
MAKLVSKTYGDALFDLAVEENKIDALVDEVKDVKEALIENPELFKLLNHPKIVKEEKEKIIENIFDGKVSKELAGFLKIIVSKGRQQDMIEILEYFINEVKDNKKIGVVSVTSAKPLTESQKERIEKRIAETTEYRSLEMNYQVQEEIIGGLIIRIKDRVVDSSIRTKIEELRKRLLKIQLG